MSSQRTRAISAIDRIPEPHRTVLAGYMSCIEAERTEALEVISRLRGIMTSTGFWSDAARLRSLAERLTVPDPNGSGEEG